MFDFHRPARAVLIYGGLSKLTLTWDVTLLFVLIFGGVPVAVAMGVLVLLGFEFFLGGGLMLITFP